MISAHFAAVVALLGAESTLVGKVFDSARTDDTGVLVRDTYIILMGGGPARLDAERYTADQAATSPADFDYTVRSVGPTSDAARAVATKAFGVLVGARPTVAARWCTRIRHTGAEATRADDSTKPPMFYSDDEYTFTSYPA